MAANGRDHSKAKAVVSNSSIVNKFPELRAILDGNARFQAEHSHDKDLSSLAENGQHPNIRPRLLLSPELADEIQVVHFHPLFGQPRF